MEAPQSLRALYGSEGVRNACHGSDSGNKISKIFVLTISKILIFLVESANRELNFFFGPKSNLRTTATFTNCSCAVLKPHLFQDGNVGRVIDHILSKGFEISALDLF